MKKLSATLIGSFCIIFCSAQPADENFKAYEQPIPGSTLQCKMVPVKGGSFLLGSNEKEKNRDPDEGPQRNVTISPFWMAAYEVTRDEFDIFYKDETISQYSTVDAITRPTAQYIDLSWGMGKEGGYPVNSMSQYAALMYCRWLYNKTGVFYRLPTEAEWEYACRAGTTTSYYFGNDPKALDKYAWYSGNSNSKFQKAGQKLPNAWGLYDMLGNVSEWTLDHYDEKAMEKMTGKSTDPIVPPNKSRYPKALRGGCFADDATQLRCANRFKSDPSWNLRDPQIPKSKWWLTEASFVGFRIIRPKQPPSKEKAEEFFNQYLGK